MEESKNNIFKKDFTNYEKFTSGYDKNNIITIDGKVTSFDFSYKTYLGSVILNQITEDNKYVYEVFFKNDIESDQGYYYGIVVLDEPMSDIVLPNDVYTHFNKEILTYLLKNDRDQILDRASQLDTIVIGDFNGKPWANLEDAIKISKDEISSGIADDKNIVDKMISTALEKKGKTL